MAYFTDDYRTFQAHHEIGEATILRYNSRLDYSGLLPSS